MENVFAVLKRLCGFTKVRYRGLAKNATRTFGVLGLAHITWRAGILLHECARDGQQRRLRP